MRKFSTSNDTGGSLNKADGCTIQRLQPSAETVDRARLLHCGAGLSRARQKPFICAVCRPKIDGSDARVGGSGGVPGRKGSIPTQKSHTQMMSMGSSQSTNAAVCRNRTVKRLILLCDQPWKGAVDMLAHLLRPRVGSLFRDMVNFVWPSYVSIDRTLRKSIAMQYDRISHASVIEGQSVRGWTVAVATNGQDQAFAVFHRQQDAQTYADFERNRLGLKRLYADDRQ